MNTRRIERTAKGAPYAGDHSEYLRAVARMIRGAGKRAADADPDELAELLELRAHLDLAIGEAVLGQRERHSLGQLAAVLEVSRPAVAKMESRARALRERLLP